MLLTGRFYNYGTRVARKQVMKINRLFWLGWIFLFRLAPPVYATQAHGAPEGLYTHQLSHIFFIVAMGILIYWLRSRHLVRQPGWRLIQYASVFFILWSLDAFLVHYMDEQTELIRVARASDWQIHIYAAGDRIWLGLLYYFLKLDHLLCVPGMVFLYMGLRRLTDPVRSKDPGQEGSS